MSNRTHALRTQQQRENARKAQSDALIQLRDRVHVMEQSMRNLEGRVKSLEEPVMVADYLATGTEH